MKTTDIEHLQWVYDRLENVHGENPNYDYMNRFKSIIENKQELFKEVYDIEACSRLVKDGYTFKLAYLKQEYAYNHQLNYMTIHDAYTAYIFIKEIT